MSNISRVYKSREYYMNTSARGFGLLKFVNHRLLVSETNTKLIKYIEDVLIPENPGLGIYIDEDEKAIDITSLDPRVLSEAEYQNYLNNKMNAQMGDMGNGPGGSNIGASSAADVQGKSGASDSQRFAAADILKAKLAASANK